MDELNQIVERFIHDSNYFFSNLAALTTIIAFGCSFLLFCKKLISVGINKRKKNNLYEKLSQFYTRKEIDHSIRYYIKTKCLETDPAVYDEPSDLFATNIKKEDMFKRITESINSEFDNKYIIVLADSGMGKTTMMINLFRVLLEEKRCTYIPVLIPAGITSLFEIIDCIEEKYKKILLLDGLDEDASFQINPIKRIKEIYKLTANFYKVIITSRSQLVTISEISQIKTNTYMWGPQKGEYGYLILYLAPFSQKDIKYYIIRKYPSMQYVKRKKALKICAAHWNLFSRPMILSFINEIVMNNMYNLTISNVYDTVIRSWISHERNIKKKELIMFYYRIAEIILQKQLNGLSATITEAELSELRIEFGIDDSVVRSRALLNRDSSGKYKFAHKTILEYLIAEQTIFAVVAEERKYIECVEQIALFYREIFVNYFILPFLLAVLENQQKRLVRYISTYKTTFSSIIKEAQPILKQFNRHYQRIIYGNRYHFIDSFAFSRYDFFAQKLEIINLKNRHYY